MKFNTALALAVVTVKLSPSLSVPSMMEPPALSINSLVRGLSLKKPIDCVHASVPVQGPISGSQQTIPSSSAEAVAEKARGIWTQMFWLTLN